ncbi:hypothetical protein KSF73_16380 [Burkholderiaceae bacterium DAT-1]|nr:hypothetical protein [Burkholderiaceae bacterium DAT-1]
MGKWLDDIKMLLGLAASPPLKVLDFGQIERLHLTRASDCEQIIDDQTWHDLDMADRFADMDDAVSPLGQQMQYHTLRSAPQARQAGWLPIIRSMQADRSAHQIIRTLLKPLASDAAFAMPAFLRDFRGQSVPSTSRIAIHAILPLLCLAGLTLSSWFAPLLLISLVANFMLSKVYERRIRIDFRRLGYLNTMATVASRLNRSAALKRLPALFDACALNQAMPSPDIRVSVLTYDLGASDTQFNPVGMLITYANHFFLLNILQYTSFARRVDRERSQYISLMDALARVDMLQGLVAYVDRFDSLCAPEMNDVDEVLTLEEAYHPALANPVPNDIRLKRCVAVLTGANMAGKSTLMRVIALNALLAQSLGFCHARRARLPLLVVRTSLSLRDSIQDGASYFHNEARRMREMLARIESGERALYLIDEPFKGTNRPERLAALIALGKWLHGKGIVILATHDTELCGHLPDAMPLQLTSSIHADGELRYDYLLKPGVSDDRYALHVMSCLGFPAEIIQQAKSHLDVDTAIAT